MNKIRKRQIINMINGGRDTLGQGSYHSITKEQIYETFDMLEELLEELENTPTKEDFLTMKEDINNLKRVAEASTGVKL